MIAFNPPRRGTLSQDGAKPVNVFIHAHRDGGEDYSDALNDDGYLITNAEGGHSRWVCASNGGVITCAPGGG